MRREDKNKALMQWACAVHGLDQKPLGQLRTIAVQASLIGLSAPEHLRTRRDFIGWIAMQRRIILDRAAEEASARGIPFPATVNGVLCDLTATECNAFLRSLPPVPLWGEADNAA